MNAPEKALQFKAWIVAAIAFLTALWGWVGWAVIIWVACIVLDYATGTWAAKSAGDWSSAVARAGLWHKLGEIVAVLVAALCDIAISVIINGAGIDIGITFGTQLGSIIENAGKLGAPIPEWLKKWLRNYKDKIDSDHEPPVEIIESEETQNE